MASSIRTARPSDVEAMLSSDPRRRFISESVDGGRCFVAVVGDMNAGYAVPDYTFYDNGFVRMLMVSPGYQVVQSDTYTN